MASGKRPNKTEGTAPRILGYGPGNRGEPDGDSGGGPGKRGVPTGDRGNTNCAGRDRGDSGDCPRNETRADGGATTTPGGANSGAPAANIDRMFSKKLALPTKRKKTQTPPKR